MKTTIILFLAAFALLSWSWSGYDRVRDFKHYLDAAVDAHEEAERCPPLSYSTQTYAEPGQPRGVSFEHFMESHIDARIECRLFDMSNDGIICRRKVPYEPK